MNAITERFVQKCPICGALNYTSNPETPVERCKNCYKDSVGSIKPTEYFAERVEEDSAEEIKNVISNRPASVKDEEKSEKVEVATDRNDEKERDEDSIFQAGKLSRSIGRIISNKNEELLDDDDIDWSRFTEEPKKITLTAKCGQFSFDIEPDEKKPYILGRSANQGSFLDSDLRVSNEHCSIFYENGQWYVKDEHSGNGTAVNSIDIGYGGKNRLNNGDELKLGHHSDSITFRITI